MHHPYNSAPPGLECPGRARVHPVAGKGSEAAAWGGVDRKLTTASGSREATTGWDLSTHRSDSATSPSLARLPMAMWTGSPESPRRSWNSEQEVAPKAVKTPASQGPGEMAQSDPSLTHLALWYWARAEDHSKGPRGLIVHAAVA